jgi:signal peptidase I
VVSVPKPETGRGALVELVVIVSLAIGLALVIQAFLVKPFQIPSGSMEPTLDIGQRVLVNRFLYHLEDPEIGDIVVFHPPAGAVDGGPAGGGECGAINDPKGDRDDDDNTYDAVTTPCPKPTPESADDNFIKRVVAGPGDRLYIENGHPVVNGQPLEEDYTKACGGLPECNLPEEIVIPPDHYFMMGDNRGASDDSRSFGPVPRDWLVGQAFATYWPPDRIGIF